MAKSSTVNVPVSMTVTTVGLKELQQALKAAADGTAKQLRLGLKGAGQIVQEQAQENASFSSKIPGKIKVSVGQRAIAVYAKDGEAVSYETHGKHPVYDKRKKRWNKVPLKRPFLAPAAESKADEVASAILDAVTNVSLFQGD